MTDIISYRRSCMEEDRMRERAEKAEAERDAYKKAKAENDERFMRERDEARAERDALQAKLDAMRPTPATLPDLEDGL